MKFTRKIAIEFKIITEENLKELARLIVEEAKKTEEGKARLELGYEGGYSEAEEGLSIFESSNFGKKRLRYAIFSMRDWRNTKGIMVELHHGFWGESYFLIEGEDPDWVRGKAQLLEDIRKSWKKRFFLFLSYPSMTKKEIYALNASFFLFMFNLWAFLALLYVPSLSEGERVLLFFRVLALFLISISSVALGNILWPCVELDVRPSKLSTWRKIISGIIGTIFFGLVTNFLYDYFFK